MFLSSNVRAPSCVVTLNGSNILTGVQAAEITTNNHFASDRFRLTLAASGLPLGENLGYWSQSDRDLVQIDLKDDSGIFSFVGVVDDVEMDMATQTLTLNGRDRSGDIIDTKIAGINSDQAASDIVIAIAKEHGLTANVQATQPIKNGKVYQQAHVRLTQDQSEWDLLTFLAQQEGFDLWVSGNTLNFLPPVALTYSPYVLTWQANKGNFKDLKLRRSQTLAKDVIVKVRSWNQAQGKTFNATAKVTGAYKSQRSNGLAQIYSFNVPNLDQQQADAWAKAKAQEITRHERVVEVSLPGESTLNNRSLLKVTGTGTTWDQTYYIDSITRRMSMTGYEMEVRAKNHSTESTLN